MKTYTLTTGELLHALRESFQEGGTFPLEVTGWSMRPLLMHGRDTVWLRPFCPAQCRRGRILLFQRSDGRLVLHRVRKILPDGYRMNGDAQSYSETITQAQVIAEAYQIDRCGRRLSCTSLILRIWDALWYLTRPIRPVLFHAAHRLRRLWRTGERTMLPMQCTEKTFLE